MKYILNEQEADKILKNNTYYKNKMTPLKILPNTKNSLLDVKGVEILSMYLGNILGKKSENKIVAFIKFPEEIKISASYRYNIPEIKTKYLRFSYDLKKGEIEDYYPFVPFSTYEPKNISKDALEIKRLNNYLSSHAYAANGLSRCMDDSYLIREEDIFSRGVLKYMDDFVEKYNLKKKVSMQLLKQNFHNMLEDTLSSCDEQSYATININYINKDGLELETSFDIENPKTNVGEDELFSLFRVYLEEGNENVNDIELVGVYLVRRAKTYEELMELEAEEEGYCFKEE